MDPSISLKINHALIIKAPFSWELPNLRCCGNPPAWLGIHRRQLFFLQRSHDSIALDLCRAVTAQLFQEAVSSTRYEL